MELSFDGCVYRADIGAGSAINAFFSIDDIDAITFGNCFYRALGLACATADAGILNYICHNIYLLGSIDL